MLEINVIRIFATNANFQKIRFWCTDFCSSIDFGEDCCLHLHYWHAGWWYHRLRSKSNNDYFHFSPLHAMFTRSTVRHLNKDSRQEWKNTYNVQFSWSLMSTISREAGEKHFHRIIVSMKVLVFTRDDDLEGKGWLDWVIFMFVKWE